MWILRICSNNKVGIEALYTATLQKIRKQPVDLNVDVMKREGKLYVISGDDALSTVFLLSVYLKAQEKLLDVELFHAKQVSKEKIPKDLLDLAEKWNKRRLSYNEIKTLSRRYATPY